MKKLFLFLLKKYSSTEKQRLEIFSILNEQVDNTYTEQTVFGNVYNANIEFVMSNKFIKKLVHTNDDHALTMINSGLNKSYYDALKYIKNEKTLV